MRALLMMAIALAFVPSALALDSFPQESKWGADDATTLVRLPEGGKLRVEADEPVDVAFAEPGEPAGPARPAPEEFDVSPRPSTESWHGLPGTIELVLHRADPSRNVELFVEDDQGGAVLEWPARPPPSPSWSHALPGAGLAPTLGALGVAAAAGGAARRRRSAEVA